MVHQFLEVCLVVAKRTLKRHPRKLDGDFSAKLAFSYLLFCEVGRPTLEAS